MGFTESDDPFVQAQRETIFEGERYNFCSDGCKYIFDHEPVKFRQAWLPVHQIYQGNCGAADLPGVLQWYGMQPGDGGEYQGSLDNENWKKWHDMAEETGGH